MNLITDFLEYVAAQSACEPEGEEELSAVSDGLGAPGMYTMASQIFAVVATVVVAGYVQNVNGSQQQSKVQVKSSK